VKAKLAKAGYPKFKKRGFKDSFTIDGKDTKVLNKSLKLPKLKALKMAEPLRFAGKIVEVTVAKKAGKWFAAILVKLPDSPSRCENQERLPVGVDLGISRLATLSDGTVFENPRTLRRFEKRLRLQNKSLSRKKKGSKNREKAKRRLQVTYYKIACARQDALHKLTTFLSRQYGTICIEDLNVQGMVQNRRLAKAVSDAGFGLFRQMLEYKATDVRIVSRWFPSSKLCPVCGCLNSMPLSKRTYTCDCGYGPVDRDLNAAKNILREGFSKNQKSLWTGEQQVTRKKQEPCVNL
jgi:putative transposase